MEISPPPEADFYGAIYADDAFSSGQVAEVTVDSQENTQKWIRTGIMIANDITDAGGSIGDLTMAISPAAGPELRWDGDGSGYLGPKGSHKRVGEEWSTFPTRLRIVREGTTFTGFYTTDGGETFSEVGSATIADAAETQDVGMFTISRSDNPCTAEFSDFQIGSMESE